MMNEERVRVGYRKLIAMRMTNALDITCVNPLSATKPGMSFDKSRTAFAFCACHVYYVIQLWLCTFFTAPPLLPCPRRYLAVL